MSGGVTKHQTVNKRKCGLFEEETAISKDSEIDRGCFVTRYRLRQRLPEMPKNPDTVKQRVPCMHQENAKSNRLPRVRSSVLSAILGVSRD